MALIGLISIGGTYNYLSENRLKWSMANHLITTGLMPDSIDAGYEWLGWNWYHHVNPQIKPYYNPDRTWYTNKIFPDNTREYIISYDRQKENYKLIEIQNYPKMFADHGTLYLLHYEPSN